MDFIDDARRAAAMAIPGPGTPEAQRKAFDAMPMQQLAALWCELQYHGLRDHTPELWARLLYFDHLPHDAPERALELALTVLRSEAHKSVKMELNNKLMPTLVGQGARLIGEFEKQARDTPQLRWLLGGVYRWTSDASVEARLAAIADEDAWRVDYRAREAASPAIDFAALSIPELAQVWVEQTCKPSKDQDANARELADYESELKREDPDRLLDLVLEILRIEQDPHVLSYLAAGSLEDVVSMATIARIEREAAASEAFCALLGGIWYHRAEPELKRRLDVLIESAHGRNWRN